MYSYHPDQGALGRGDCYARCWQPAEDKSLTQALVGWATSPILFQDGRRLESSFLAADWVGLDFDEGPTLSEMTRTFCDVVHVIGTTKSHGKPKNGKPACDRFRVWLRLTDTITSAASYKATVRRLVGYYDADPACVGAAQLFWPCRELTSVLREGDTTDIVQAEEKTYSKTSVAYTGRIPYWVRDWLNGRLVNFGTKDGANFHVFKSALWLAKNGWSENDIVDLVMDSPKLIGTGTAAISPRDIRKSVRSGIERALKENSR